MSKSGVKVSPECVSAFNELKLGKSIAYIIYKLSDDYKEIVVESTSTERNWDEFREKLLNAKSSHRGKEGAGPRYAVYDFKYQSKDGEGERNKITFIAWSPDEDALIFPKMTYASSKEGLKNALSGLGADVQANREDDLEYGMLIDKISKGKGSA